jgi:nucleotide-binding universal stress UspA family protein
MATAFPTIGCSIDRSAAAALAIAEGLRLRDLGVVGAVCLVHVVEPPPPLHAGPFTYVEPDPVARAEARAWLDERLASAPGATGVLLDGPPGRAVCEWAASTGAGLLLVAAHRGVIDRAIHGRFAGHVTYHSPCPVLVIHPPHAEG